MMTSDSFWWEDAGRPTAPPTTPLPPAADVVIVGAGLTALSAAPELAHKRRSVLVVPPSGQRAEAGTDLWHNLRREK